MRPDQALPPAAPHSLAAAGHAGVYPLANRLLAALPAQDLHHWLPQIEAVDMPAGMVLRESGRPSEHAYFPITSIVSLLYDLQSGASAEVAVVGAEGMVDLAPLMGGGTSLSRIVVLSTGRGLRMRSRALLQEFDRGGAATQLLMRYTLALMAQIAQTAACNRHHSLDERLCKLLLLSLDRNAGKTLQLTHEVMGALLGVRREGVTEALHGLHRAGLVRCARGSVTVLDRPGLEARACECYAVVRREYERLLPP